ncbi:unnamed protein product [Phytophthora fragariaefolia]|uniref:Unnamed protein product n=1 Tax=Phytophthora fragariaefolia TaxID=1490495 RepID=A0A9W6TT20_9STRA|nr:unnamed protein product [Phytophthora fragariaefolia]
MTLDQVKQQLRREQQQRVEKRIQTLQEAARPTAAAAASVPLAAATADPAPVAGVGLEQSAVEPEVAQPPSSAEQGAPPTAHAAVTAAAATTERPSSPAQNEFIIDDMEEDLMFARALEEVERKLTTPQKPPTSVPMAAATDPNKLALESVQVPVVSPVPVPAKASPVAPQTASQPTHSAIASQPQQPVEATKLVASPAVVVAPEVLEEMERLRRENELLRRSNELLQAAVTSPMQKETVDKQQGCLNEHSDSPGTRNDVAKSPRSTLTDTPAAAPTARYLDLARCDSDHDNNQTVPIDEEIQPVKQTIDEHFTASINALPEPPINTETPAYNSESGEMELRESEQNDFGQKHRERDSELKTLLSKHQQASLPPSPVHSPPSYKHSHQATEAATGDPESDHARGPASPTGKRSQKNVKESTASTGGDDDGVSDVNMSEAEVDENDIEGDVSDVNVSDAEVDENEMEGDDEDETAVEYGGPALRTSTIDSGNYKEYKTHDEDDFEAAEDESDVVHGSNSILPDEDTYFALTGSAPNGVKPHDPSLISELDDPSKPATPTNSEILERTTAPSSPEDDEKEEDEDDEVVVVNRPKRREVIALSSSESVSESESQGEEEEASDSDDAPSGNVLEAALKAAGSDSRRKSPNKISCAVSNTVKKDGTAPISVSPPLKAEKTTIKKRKTPSSLSSKKPSSVKSSLLWPALDDFYDFLLELSPRNVRSFDQKRKYLQKYDSGKLPTQHSSIKDYCNIQLEAIMEELVASVSNTTDRRGGGGSGPTRHLSLSSVSPCGGQGLSTSSLGLSFGAIFTESGFTGSLSNSNDYILTFDASALGKKSASDFMSGDLVLVRSPRWKNYEMCVFGVVLCDSVVAVGGKSNAGYKGGNGGSGEKDQICVLVRAQKRDGDNAVETFGVLMELCLSNQRAPNWRWALQHVHNTTTSAREFQAIKSISFFSNDLKQVLLRGQLISSIKTEQASKKSAAASSILSPHLLKYLQKHYNESQMQAILGCLGEDSRIIIQGPPGTGKTKTILGLLSALLDGAGLSTLQKAKGTARIRVGASLQSARTSAASKTVAETSIRILVAAPSNAAVDELVVRVLSEGLYDGGKGETYRPRIVRVGRPESNQKLSSLAAAREASESKKNRKKMRKYAREVEEVLLESLVMKHRSTFPTVKQARQAIIKNAQIVFCTLSGAGSVAMCEFAQDFDALIIDEAAQAVEASTLIPFKFRPHRVVLVGDHRQLPATVISKNLVSMGYDRSLQQRLVENKSPVLLLTQQYRMHPEIAEFPSTFFYGGRLVQDDNMRNWTAQDYHRDNAFKPLLFLDVQGTQSQVSGSTSLRNMSEVEAVVQLIRRLLKKFPHVEWKKRIGVIAPYKQQIYEVCGAIGKLESEFGRHVGVEVNTVDGFQGREKEIIIYSCVRTSHGGRKKKKKSKGEEDDILDAFWADERRMNVAITRAKSSLWIVGNSNLLKQSRAWRALIQHTKDHSRYVSDGASLFTANSSTKKSSKAPSKTRRGRRPNDPKGFKVKMNGKFQEAAWVMHKSRVVAHRGAQEMATETTEELQRRLERRREVELEIEARQVVAKRLRVASREEAEDEELGVESRSEAAPSEPTAVAQLVHLPTTGWRCPGIVPDAFYREHMELVHAFANLSGEDLSVLSKFKHSSDMNLNVEGRKLKQAAITVVQHFSGAVKSPSGRNAPVRPNPTRSERFDRAQQPLSMEVMMQLQSLDSTIHDETNTAISESLQSQDETMHEPASPNVYLIQQTTTATPVDRIPSPRNQ